MTESVRPPLPPPPGITQEQIERMPVDDSWRMNNEYVCCTCGEPAFLNPFANQIWGCKKCGMNTYSAAIFFKKRT